MSVSSRYDVRSFNVVGEVPPSAHVERVLRDFYAGKVAHCHLSVNALKHPM